MSGNLPGLGCSKSCSSETVRMEKIRSQGLTTETDAEIGQMQRSISFGIMGGTFPN